MRFLPHTGAVHAASHTTRTAGAFYTYPDAARKKIAVKVVDIFGNDTMTIVEVSVGQGEL